MASRHRKQDLDSFFICDEFFEVRSIKFSLETKSKLREPYEVSFNLPIRN